MPEESKFDQVMGQLAKANSKIDELTARLDAQEKANQEALEKAEAAAAEEKEKDSFL